MTTPEVSAEKAFVKLKIKVENETTDSGDLKINSRLISPEGQLISEAKTTIDPLKDSKAETEQIFEVLNPALWSVESPKLYQVFTEVSFDGKVVDQQTTTFGIRSLEFSAEKGFLLNGKQVLLKGGCMHHDNGPLGSATIDRAEERPR